MARHISGEFRGFVLPLLGGVVVGGFLLAGGDTPWWVELGTLAGKEGSLFSDVVSALMGPLFSVVLFAAPVGNLPVASNMFKTYTVTFPGLISFILASVVNPRTVGTYIELFGRKKGFEVSAYLLVAAVLSGLLVTWMFAIFGFRPGHVPLFRELVDKIIMTLPFTMPPMGAMPMR